MQKGFWLLFMVFVVFVYFIGCTSRETPVTQKQPLFDTEKLGTVDFPVSCNTVAEQMQHGVALLHHMMYTEADLVFQSVIDQDSSCAMGYWGRAMSLIHPLWPDVLSEAQLDKGLALVRQALALHPKTEREKVYINAVGAYFSKAKLRTTQERLIAFHQGWQKVYESN